MNNTTQPTPRSAVFSQPRRKTPAAAVTVKTGKADITPKNGGRSHSVRSGNGSSHPAYFALWAPLAIEVSVVGHFNHWDSAALPLKRDGDGCWVAAVQLPTGAHEYLFVVDGALMLDPEAQSVRVDSVGSHSVLTVPRPAVSIEEIRRLPPAKKIAERYARNSDEIRMTR